MQSGRSAPPRALSPAGPAPSPGRSVGLLDGLGVLAGRAVREVLLVLPSAPLDPRLRARLELLGAELVDRGVRVRALGPENLDDPACGGSAIRMAALGVELLAVPQPPLWMAVADRDAAIVPTDPLVEQAGWVFLRGVAPVTACRLLFEQLWDQGRELNHGGEPERGPGPDRREREVLRLLDEGLTDAAIAARTGLSVRTNRRTIADLMTRLGARSRFQAGAEAARRAWV
ncbi:LuxR C-terminal-related transcriptional regulator [Kitasatospora sp. NPDC056651]|uniref:helix-turn-helix transcriptional regulator n=1 Tax=Kitasatospora sp. NPDC056651 TaxID=3345892 RepID=UPI003673AE1E